ncbi:coiled-coil domain-containing protein 34 [Microcaecilia unicolor]|uniref:Coiled-coil domain-containing protein 34 n=1 Tax=Microcaecilia unicolor TaxID=1415580 RepID=A0A6P7XVM2_9AMPH|nr:coiled-coil domain-containing protein 34 [Microcaecilia unicolor]
MSDSQNKDYSSGMSRSHSTPRKLITEKGKGLLTKIHHVSSSGDSTSSLISPIYHDSFESETAGQRDSSAKEPRDAGFEDILQKDREKSRWQDTTLTPWEEWLLNKERKERIRLQNRFVEESKKQQEQIKEKLQQEMKKKVAEEKHKEWIQKKIELEEEEKQLAELQEKKERSKRVFEEWLQNCKNKPRPLPNTYGYGNGKLSGYYDASCYPSPSFFNPVPWKPIQAPPPSRDMAFLMKKNKLSKMYDPMYEFPFKTKENSVPKIKRT